MTELQLYHWIATGALTILITILGFLGKGVIEDMKTKLSKEEFAAYLQDAKNGRAEIRDTLIKLFEKAEQHEKRDTERFDLITKDFNGGLQSLRDMLYTSKLEIFEKINGKADKARGA